MPTESDTTTGFSTQSRRQITNTGRGTETDSPGKEEATPTGWKESPSGSGLKATLTSTKRLATAGSTETRSLPHWH